MRELKNNLLQKKDEAFLRLGCLVAESILIDIAVYVLLVRVKLSRLLAELKNQILELKMNFKMGYYCGLVVFMVRLFFCCLSRGVLWFEACLILIMLFCVLLLIYSVFSFQQKKMQNLKGRLQADLTPVLLFLSLSAFLKKETSAMFFSDFAMLLRLSRKGIITLEHAGHMWKSPIRKLRMVEDLSLLNYPRGLKGNSQLNPIEEKLQPFILQGFKIALPQHKFVTHGKQNTGVFNIGSDRGKLLANEYIQKSHIEAQPEMGILRKWEKEGGIDFVPLNYKINGLPPNCTCIDAKTIMTPWEYFKVDKIQPPKIPGLLRAYDTTFLKFGSESKGLQIISDLNKAHKNAGWEPPLYTSDFDLVGYKEAIPGLMAKLEVIEKFIMRDLPVYPRIYNLVDSAPLINKDYTRLHQDYFKSFYDDYHKEEMMSFIEMFFKYIEKIKTE